MVMVPMIMMVIIITATIIAVVKMLANSCLEWRVRCL